MIIGKYIPENARQIRYIHPQYERDEDDNEYIWNEDEMTDVCDLIYTVNIRHLYTFVAGIPTMREKILVSGISLSTITMHVQKEMTTMIICMCVSRKLADEFSLYMTKSIGIRLSSLARRLRLA
mgnify:CR=1 FL=1